MSDDNINFGGWARIWQPINMSESNSRSSPRSQIKTNRHSDVSLKPTSEKRRFDEDMSPVSPRESPTPSSSSERSPSSRHTRHHHRHPRHKYDRRRDREMASFGRLGRTRDDEERFAERKRRRLAYETTGTEEEATMGHGDIDESSKRTRRRGSEYKSETSNRNEATVAEEMERQSREKYRKDRGKRPMERGGEEAVMVERKACNRKYANERDSHRENRGQGERLKRGRRRSDSQHSQSRALSHTEVRPLSTVKQHLNPFVSTLLKPLVKEETSDTELEEMLPVGMLFGEMAKRSMPVPSEQSKKVNSSQLQQLQPRSRAQQSQDHPLQSEQTLDQASATKNKSKASNDAQTPKSVEERDNRFDKFLSNLSERMHEKEQEPENWNEREIDFSDILSEEGGALRLAVSSAVLKPKQLLESSLFTPWQKITERSPGDTGEGETIGLETETTEEKEGSLNLIALLSSNIVPRFLDDQLARELEERGVTFPSNTASQTFADTKGSRLGMVPTIFGEIAWRQKLLGVI